MGIGPAVGSWLANLHDRGIFAQSASVIEMGPSEFNWPKPTLAAFLEKNFRSKGAAAHFIANCVTKRGEYHQPGSKAFYGLLGLSDYNSIDYGDQTATIRHNLNLAMDPPNAFDVVADFGTLEHIFNIGEAFRTVHNLLRPGGIALHQLPTNGGYYHGFYNISSVAYRSLIAANKYEVVDLLYVHDVMREDERAGRGLAPRFEDIVTHEVRLQTVKFCYNYFSSILFGRERTSSQIFAALRKVSDAPFIFPQQINKYSVGSEPSK